MKMYNAEYQKKWRAAHPEYVAKWQYSKRLYRSQRPGRLKSVWKYALKKLYGLSETDYYRMLDEQKGLCAVCGLPPKRNKLHVDHDHITNRVRGLVCPSCNHGLYFLETSAWREKAQRYLEKYNAKAQRP